MLYCSMHRKLSLARFLFFILLCVILGYVFIGILIFDGIPIAGRRPRKDSNWIQDLDDGKNIRLRKEYVLEESYTTASLFMNQQKRINLIVSSAPKWHKRVLKGAYINATKRYNLTEILMVRIYDSDKAKWTIKELKQWLHYMFWAGIEHVYLCDHYTTPDEKLDKRLWKYIEDGLLTYLPWVKTYSMADLRPHQVKCYNSVLQRYGSRSKWQLAVDMDEFPFCPDDTNEGFLQRYLVKFEQMNVAQILMNNYLLLGQGNRSRTMTIERLDRITPTPANRLTKPVYRPVGIMSADIHRWHVLRKWASITANDLELKMLHYWGARTQNWGPDTPEILNKTISFTAVREQLAPKIRNSLQVYGEVDAFSNTTGP